MLDRRKQGPLHPRRCAPSSPPPNPRPPRSPPFRPPASLPAIWGSEGSHALSFLEAEDRSSSAAAGGAHQAARWSPYEFNGGTALGIAGADFAVVAADTRLSEGYSILSRSVSKARQLTPSCVIATGGCWTDVATLHKVIAQRCETYRADHEADVGTPAVAQMLGNTLYYRRFFPYYAFNVVARVAAPCGPSPSPPARRLPPSFALPPTLRSGLDAEGKGAVYTYDAVGSFERVTYAAQGAGQKLIIPLLDNIVGGKNRADAPPGGAGFPLTKEAAVEICKDAFVTAGERDIYTGDAVEVFTITKAGVKKERFELKRD